MTVRCRVIVTVALLLTLDVLSARTKQAGELIERTLAIVAGQALTLSEVRAAVTLGLVNGVDSPVDIAGATPRLVDRMLMLREVQRYAPPEPQEGDLERQLAAVRARFPTPDLYARALQSGGFSEARLRAWIRDDLRVAAYLAQRFAAVAAPADPGAGDTARDRAVAERQAALIANWLDDLRRRTPIVELWKTP